MRAKIAKEVAEGKKQIKAEAAKDGKSAQQAGGVAAQHIKDVAEAERQIVADYAGAAAREALKKAAESLPTLSALEASSPDACSSSSAYGDIEVLNKLVSLEQY